MTFFWIRYALILCIKMFLIIFEFWWFDFDMFIRIKFSAKNIFLAFSWVKIFILLQNIILYFYATTCISIKFWKWNIFTSWFCSVEHAWKLTVFIKIIVKVWRFTIVIIWIDPPEFLFWLSVVVFFFSACCHYLVFTLISCYLNFFMVFFK